MDEVRPDNSFFEQSWPEGLPIPNEEQWQAAECRYREENRKHNENLSREGNVDVSDWQCGLGFVVATYSPVMWKALFDAGEM